MRKFFIIFSMLLYITAIESFAQTEIRGVETKRVIYDGPEYQIKIVVNGGFAYATKTQYYGWEFTNRNSIPVSIAIELWEINTLMDIFVKKGEEHYLRKTKDIVLESGESYVFKCHDDLYTQVYNNYGDKNTEISNFYIKYKAYKLE